MTWHDAHLLKLAFRCMQLAQPIRWREALVECRRSRRQRRLIVRDLRAHPCYSMLCTLDGVRP